MSYKDVETNPNDIKLFLDYKQSLLDRFNGKKDDTGFPIIEWPLFLNRFRPALGTLNIITGIPSHGKSSFMTAMMVSLAKNYGINWAVFSPEEYPTDRHISKIIEIWSGKKNIPSDITEEEMIKFSDKASPHFRFLEPPEEKITLNYILRLTKESIEENKTSAIVI